MIAEFVDVYRSPEHGVPVLFEDRRDSGSEQGDVFCNSYLHVVSGRPVLGISISKTEGPPRSLAHLVPDRIGFVFQPYNLVTVLTVRENVVLPQRLARRRPDVAKADTVLAVIATISPVLVPPLMRLWMGIVPARLAPRWFLARQSVTAYPRRTAATVIPMLTTTRKEPAQDNRGLLIVHEVHPTAAVLMISQASARNS